MNGSVSRAAAVVLVGVLALAAAAATLRSPVVEGAPGSGGGPNGSGLFPFPDEPTRTGGFQIHIPAIVELLFLAILGLLLVVALVWSVYHYREALSMAAVTVAVVVIVGALILLMDGLLSGAGGSGSQGPPGGGGSGGLLLPSEGGTASSGEFPMLLAVFALVLLTAVVTFVGATGNLRPGSESRNSPPSGDTRAMGEAAGRAADRIQATSDEASVDNEVYRAWGEMTALLDLDNPETRTPGEFAAAAVSAGMDESDVRELTGLFEEVRYGERPPEAADRESRAVSVLRNIESQYAADGPGVEER